MTPDSWERRNVPYSPGYNNPANNLTFTVTYDEGLDVLVVTSNFPVLTDVDTINYAGTNGSGQLFVGTHFTVDSPTQITVQPPAGANLGAPTDLTQLDFYSAGPTLVGTWTGTENVPVAGVPVIEAYSYSDFYDLASSPPSFLSQECSNVATRTSTPSIFFYTQNMLTGGADGVRLVVDGSPVDYTVTADPQFFGDGAIAADGYFLFADPALLGTQITSAQPIDSGGNPVGAVTPLVINYNTVAGAGIQSSDSDVLQIEWAFCPEQPTQINVTRCPSGGQNYYDPAGPNSGLNPVGATIVQWDTSAIIIDHAAFIGLGPIDRIETEDQYGRTLCVVGDPLPTVAALPAAEPIVTSVTQSASDEITIAGNFFTTATDGQVDNIVVDGSFGTLVFCTPASPSFPGCLPPGAGVGTLNETSWNVSAPDLVGATITNVTVNDYVGNYSVPFDVSPDLVMV